MKVNDTGPSFLVDMLSIQCLQYDWSKHLSSTYPYFSTEET